MRDVEQEPVAGDRRPGLGPWPWLAAAAVIAMAGVFAALGAGFGERPPCERLRALSCDRVANFTADERADCERLRGRAASADTEYCAQALVEIASVRSRAWTRMSEESRQRAEAEERAAGRRAEMEEPSGDRCVVVLEACMKRCGPTHTTPPSSAAELEARLAAFEASGAVECSKRCARESGC